MEMNITVTLTDVQYMKLDELARRMRRPMDKALGLMVSGHMDSLIENTHVEKPKGPKPIDWGKIK